jgi:hypothetical protein
VAVQADSDPILPCLCNHRSLHRKVRNSPRSGHGWKNLPLAAVETPVIDAYYRPVHLHCYLAKVAVQFLERLHSVVSQNPILWNNPKDSTPELQDYSKTRQ